MVSTLTERVFSYQHKLVIFTRYQSSKIVIILHQNLNLVRSLLFLCPYKLLVISNFYINFKKKNEKLCSI